jgi:putative PIN family toxin of toxin-antitoxin system
VKRVVLDRVLRDKFLWAEREIEDVRRLLRGIAQPVEPVQTLDVIKRDPDDNRVLECAVTAASEVIVTGDTNLLSLKTYAGIRIVRVAEFLAQCVQPPEP